MVIRLTPAVKALLVSCFLIFLIQHTGDEYFGTHFLEIFGLIPHDVLVRHWIWQFGTYSFLHSEVMQLFFNLLLIAFVGSELEAVWGAAQFLKYYFFCAVCSGLAYFLIQTFLVRGSGMHMPLLGASGAIYGLLMAFGVLFGERVMLFMLLFPLKAKHFVLLLGVFELMTTLYSSSQGVASIAHLSGMAAGFVYLWGRARFIILRKQQQGGGGRQKPKARPRSSKHLKLIVNNPKNPNNITDDADKDKPPRLWH